MRMEKLWRAILLSLFVSLWLAAGFGGTATAAKKIRVAIGLDGANNDKGWYESGYQGALKLKKDPGVAEVTF